MYNSGVNNVAGVMRQSTQQLPNRITKPVTKTQPPSNMGNSSEIWLNKCVSDWLQGRQFTENNPMPNETVIGSLNSNQTKDQLTNNRCDLNNPPWSGNAFDTLEIARKDCQRQLDGAQNDFKNHFSDFMRARKERKNINNSCDWVDVTGKKDWGGPSLGRSMGWSPDGKPIPWNTVIQGEIGKNESKTGCAKRANNKGKRFFVYTDGKWKDGVGRSYGKWCYIPDRPPTSTPASNKNVKQYLGMRLYEKQCGFSDPLNCKKDEDCPTFAGTMKCVAPKFPETDANTIEKNCDKLSKLNNNFTFVKSSESCLPGVCNLKGKAVNGFTPSNKDLPSSVKRLNKIELNPKRIGNGTLKTQPMDTLQAAQICANFCNNKEKHPKCIGFEIEGALFGDATGALERKKSCTLLETTGDKSCLNIPTSTTNSGRYYIRRCTDTDENDCKTNNGSFINTQDGGFCSFNKNWNIAEMGGVCQSVGENTCQKLNRNRKNEGPGVLSWNNLDLETLRGNFKSPCVDGYKKYTDFADNVKTINWIEAQGDRSSSIKKCQEECNRKKDCVGFNLWDNNHCDLIREAPTILTRHDKRIWPQTLNPDNTWKKNPSGYAFFRRCASPSTRSSPSPPRGNIYDQMTPEETELFNSIKYIKQFQIDRVWPIFENILKNNPNLGLGTIVELPTLPFVRYLIANKNDEKVIYIRKILSEKSPSPGNDVVGKNLTPTPKDNSTKEPEKVDPPGVGITCKWEETNNQMFYDDSGLSDFKKNWEILRDKKLNECQENSFAKNNQIFQFDKNPDSELGKCTIPKNRTNLRVQPTEQPGISIFRNKCIKPTVGFVSGN